MKDKILVFTDGAAKGNPGRGGYGVVITYDEKVLEKPIQQTFHQRKTYGKKAIPIKADLKIVGGFQTLDWLIIILSG